MYYGDKVKSKVEICHTLMGLGWEIYGYKEDMSDCMTDYFDPADWDEDQKCVRASSVKTNDDDALRKYTYSIKQDMDTRDNSTIYVVKLSEKLSKEEFIELSKYIKTHGGHYSKFKRGFLFKKYPEFLDFKQRVDNKNT